MNKQIGLAGLCVVVVFALCGNICAHDNRGRGRGDHHPSSGIRNARSIVGMSLEIVETATRLFIPQPVVVEAAPVVVTTVPVMVSAPVYVQPAPRVIVSPPVIVRPAPVIRVRPQYHHRPDGNGGRPHRR